MAERDLTGMEPGSGVSHRLAEKGSPVGGPPPAVHAREVSSRRLLATWYVALLAGALPALLVGFLASALANKIAFAAWGLGLALAHALLLRWGLESGWAGWVLTGRIFLLFAAGAAVWMRLALRYGEELDLGFRAVAPSLYFPALAQPRTALVSTVALGVAGALAILIGHGAERLRRPAR